MRAPSPTSRDSRLRAARARRFLRRFPRARSAYSFLAECRRALADYPTTDHRALEEWYRAREDPWDYRSVPEERVRYETAAGMVGRAAGRRPLHALEIGCGEGIFTTMLAPLCASVLAVDVSEVALSRARERCAEFDHVRFCCWDVCSDPPLGTFGIVVCMDVVDTIHWPPAQRRAIAKVDRSVAPRGSLIVTAVLQSPVVENANWGRRLGRGGQNIVARFSAQDRRLVRRETHLTDHHILTRFAASR